MFSLTWVMMERRKGLCLQVTEQAPATRTLQLTAHPHEQMGHLYIFKLAECAHSCVHWTKQCWLRVLKFPVHPPGQTLTTKLFHYTKLFKCSLCLCSILSFSSEMWMRDCVTWCHAISAVRHRPSFIRVLLYSVSS